MPDPALLFRPFISEKLQLKNRLLMAPMTRQQSPHSIPGQNVVDYYRRRAEGEVGLIITEGTTVNHPVASMDENVPCFHGEALQGWRKVVDAVHDAGGKIAPQLWHLGTGRPAGKGPNPELPPMGPSGMSQPGVKDAHEMSQQDIDEVITAFAQGAQDAKELGFDAVEIHAAHGYLIDQFFWEELNQRNDRYGGTLRKRAQFAVEVVQAMREKVGPDFPIILRFSQFKIGDYEAKIARSAEELEELLTLLVDAGVDIFHASQRRFWEAEFNGSHLNLAGWAKKLTGKPSITVGSVGLDNDFISSFGGEDAHKAGIDQLLERLEREEFDLVAVGRALISDAAWCRKVREGHAGDIVPFTREALATLD